MKKILTIMLLGLALCAGAEDMAAEDAALLEELGIPVHPDVKYVYGNREAGIRFASNKSVDEIRAWYVEQLGAWAVIDQFGLWAIYDGPEGASFPDVMSTNQVTISVNDEMPGWYSLDDDMTTEVVVQIAP